ncbi:MAG: SDR family NAD(P)-dependent oxidoreductase [Brevundimonas sp.]|uniref:SDR family NAD(P)-dependent oxidoreductase n=1 Tax=Brevundimonas sp. TaxID=1871086 RepID=UPI0025B7C994|nr:SDR family NAD(P)-dependent oxidoreductase [Brevundimonas sp.]MBX3477724.1 SDR family NAD(P)-dependent oxidoreductase [Brevundimonas sp.]
MIDLSGRVAIVTGAGNGLGRAYALDLARRGAAVVVNNRRHPGQPDADTSAWRTAEAIRQAGGRAIENYGSVEAPGSGQGMVEAALETFGRLDIVVANAASPQASGFSRTSLEDFRAIFDVGFLGTLNLLHAAWPVFRQAGYGRIITTTSSAGRYGQHGLAAYGASKAAVETLTRTLAAEGARHGVRANSVSPYAASQMTADHMRPDVAALFRPEKVAPLIAWLASEACDLNGQVIVAGGGRFRRAFCVETESRPATEEDLPAVLSGLADAPGRAFDNSNQAFDTLLVEAGLPPR